MKQIILLFILICTPFCSNAQSLRLHLQGGEVLEYPASMVDSLVFVPADAEQPSFELWCEDVGIASAHLYVRPSSDDFRYYYDITTAKSFENAGGVASIVEKFIESTSNTLTGMTLSQVLEIALSQGEDDDVVQNLPSDTEFVFYAMAVDDSGKCYGNPATYRFRTLPGGDPADCTYEINYNNVSSSGASITIEPSDPSVRYWWGLCPVSTYSGDAVLMNLVESSIDEFAASSQMSREEVVMSYGCTGRTEEWVDGLEPSTAYYIFVYAINTDATAAGKMTKKRFTTSEKDVSSAGFTLSYCYFDGDELATSYPESCAKYAGSVVVDAAIEPNDDAVNWVIALASGDLSDLTLYPDAETQQAVLSAGYFNVREKRFVAKWGTATFLGFAADAMGVDGALMRQVVEFKQSGATSVTEFGVSETVSAPRETDGFQKELRATALPVSVFPPKSSQTMSSIRSIRGLSHCHLAE